MTVDSEKIVGAFQAASKAASDAAFVVPGTPVQNQPITIDFLESYAQAAIRATQATDDLVHSMKRLERQSPPWSLLAIAFVLGGLVTFLLIAVR